MKPTTIGDRLFDALASLRLAVAVIMTLALTCLSATIYESTHGTAAAQLDVYRTGWFALILATLGANIFCAMMKRYPWKEHHAGFVMAHVGILTLLAGSLLSLHFGLDSNMALFEGESTDRVALLDRALHVTLPESGAHGSFVADFERRPPRPGREPRFQVPGSDVTLVAEEFQPHVRVVESFEQAAEGSPALHFVLDNPFGREEAWLSVADPERSHLDFGPASLAFHVAATAAEVRELAHAAPGRNQISFVLGPDGALFFRLSTKAGPGPSAPVEIGRPIETPWMGMKVIVDRFLPKAVGRRVVVPEAPPEKDERRMPAVKVRLEGPAGRTASEWLLWTEARRVAFGAGQATLAYRAPEAAVPFRVTLLRFNSDKYPGSNMAETYESWVRVEDPERGVSEHHISMNHPLHYRGYIFFQASFVEGEPMMSIFSVARAPGLPLVYLGVVLIASGVLWMFYLKPYLARRRAAAALAAHRQRERRDEVPVDSGAGAVPGRPAPAEPARSGA